MATKNLLPVKKNRDIANYVPGKLSLKADLHLVSTIALKQQWHVSIQQHYSILVIYEACYHPFICWQHMYCCCGYRIPIALRFIPKLDFSLFSTLLFPFCYQLRTLSMMKPLTMRMLSFSTKITLMSTTCIFWQTVCCSCVGCPII